MVAVTDRGNDLALVEAALFLSPQPLSRRGIAKILGSVQLAYVDRLLEDLAQTYAESTRGIELLVDEGRATLRVKHAYIERVAHLAPQQDIPRPTLRTLAVIAYNQPVTQAQVIRVRGNKGYAHIQELIDRGLVRSEEHGRTLLLHLTSEFLRHFGLSSVEELKFHAPKIGTLPPLGEAGDEDEETSARTQDGTPDEEQETDETSERGSPESDNDVDDESEALQSADSGGT